VPRNPLVLDKKKEKAQASRHRWSHKASTHGEGGAEALKALSATDPARAQALWRKRLKKAYLG
jgi:hypothetical protein